MRRAAVGLLLVLSAVGCDVLRKVGTNATPTEFPQQTLAEARKSFVTKLPAARGESDGPPPTPPRGTFNLVRYTSPAGKLAAYVTPDPRDGAAHPAIVWVTGGDCNSIGPMWGRADPKNDQSAAQYREAGLVLMVPSLRGGNDNPGRREYYLGELDDVAACAAYLRTLPYVDPDRVYLGGHSTGGTVALLTAEYTDAFRAVFSFGPVDDPTGYGDEFAGFNQRDAREVEIRSPGKWLGSIKTPTFVIEGASRGNADSLARMKRGNSNPRVTFLTVRGHDHFSVLAPVNRLLARKILSDTGASCDITLTEAEAAGGR
ncbi:MAG: alpha/beta fold hydrolase [Gemmataceae bacterium]